jgi:hypothetical protein
MPPKRAPQPPREAVTTVPVHYTPRPYQQAFWAAMGSGQCQNAVLVWHRRAGKDKTLLNFLVSKAVERVGTYFYVYPTYGQAKRALWEGRDKEGFPFLGHIPAALIAARHETELKLTLTNGTILQFVGTDQTMDHVRSTNPVGVVFSEFAYYARPTVYDVVRPILRENGGWAAFAFTPNGRNHAYRLYEAAKRTPGWFTQLCTIRDTRDAAGQPIFTEADLDLERALGMEETLVQQEFFCRFDAAVGGAYFAKELELAYQQGRVGRVPWEPAIPVVTAWDLGVGDATAIWFAQVVGREVRLIDGHRASGEGLPYYVQVLKSKPYVYDRHYVPHDAEVREWGSGRSRQEQAADLGVSFTVVPKQAKDDQIGAARALLARVVADETQCAEGLDDLAQYRKDYDEARGEYLRKPRHDVHSHAADALMILALGLGRLDRDARPRPLQAEMAFNPWDFERGRPVPVGAAQGEMAWNPFGRMEG